MTTAETHTIDRDQRRRLAAMAQQLEALAGEALADVVTRTGLVRTLGGADVYLALRARVPGMARTDLEETVARGSLRVATAARGCIYLVPQTLQADCLRLTERLTGSRTAREHAKVGIGDDELAEVAEAVLATLERAGALSTQALRKALPDGTVRSLGNAGKNVGISSTLPPALRRLELEGRIERIPEDHRLDHERYRWRRPEHDPYDRSTAPADDVELAARFGAVFFRAAGVATARAFAAWLGVPLRDAKAAVERLELVPATVEGWDDPAWAHPEHSDLLADPPPPRGAALLPFEDNLVALHGGPGEWVDPSYHDVPVPVWGRGGPATVGRARHASLRSIVLGDRIVGFWELDPDAGEVVWRTFEAIDAAQRARLERLAEDTGRFLLEQLGHGRSFSIDHEKHMRKRADAVRAIGER